ncbi:MAG: dolichol-phosphate mannosyltransferase [Planctomycetota bacterium]|jgi:dolichol-phosphate mannosyltransferase
MFYFLVPAYNEEANIPLLAKNLIDFKCSDEKTFVFVDDCSSDNTIDTLKTHFAGENLEVITKEVNGGPGDSFNIGFKWIIENSKSDSDKIITLEADNTSDIGILSNMLTISDLGFDLVLASVYAQGGGFVNTSLFRKVLSITANFFIRNILDIKVLTMSSFYRVYSMSVLKNIDEKFDKIIEEEGFISMVEILYKAVKVDAKIIEVPMQLNSKNREGKSKMKIMSTGISYLKFLAKKKS